MDEWGVSWRQPDTMQRLMTAYEQFQARRARRSRLLCQAVIVACFGVVVAIMALGA